MRKENQLLNRITKFFNNTEEVNMEQKDTQAQAAGVDINEQLAAANEALASKTAELTAVSEQLAELASKFEVAQAALDVIAAEKADMIVKAKEAKLAARKEQVEAAIGTEKAGALLAATEGLEDAAFEAVVSAMAGSVATEANSGMFKEVGVAAQADADKVVEGSEGVNRILKSKYSK